MFQEELVAPRRVSAWRVAATVLVVVYFVVNAAGLAYAAMQGERLHALVHAVLLAPLAWLVWRSASRRLGND
jgi:hypothetical protein